MKIPIRNLYYIFLYAWAKFPISALGTVGVDSAPDLPSLFAHVLLDGVRRLFRRGIDRGYEAFTGELVAPRGRLRIDRMIKEVALLRAVAVCDYDVRTPNILANQIVKSTLRKLASSPDIKKGLRHELVLLSKRFMGVDDIELLANHFRLVAISGVNREYSSLMRLCEFVFWASMPDERGIESKFSKILEDEVKMSSVFEEFLRSFYRIHRADYRVGSEAPEWLVSDATEEALALLPRMVTDITLRQSSHTVIVDAKYYSKALASGPFGERIRSQHLYQLVTYLQHEQRRNVGKALMGILIYPRVDRDIRLSYRLLDVPVSIATVDLAKDRWIDIQVELNGILDECVAAGASLGASSTASAKNVI